MATLLSDIWIEPAANFQSKKARALTELEDIDRREAKKQREEIKRSKRERERGK